jgi:deoxyribonuclease V
VIACVDVSYQNNEAVAACILFRSWTDKSSDDEIVERIGQIEEYQPGEFYRRELPCLLAVLHKLREPLEAVIVDGYVWLGDKNLPGLGARLYDRLGGTTVVIGVAKSGFAGAALAVPVLRGRSKRPLYVTAAGMDIMEAARHIQEMHGKFRIPTLLKHADQLSRRER